MYSDKVSFLTITTVICLQCATTAPRTLDFPLHHYIIHCIFPVLALNSFVCFLSVSQFLSLCQFREAVAFWILLNGCPRYYILARRMTRHGDIGEFDKPGPPIQNAWSSTLWQMMWRMMGRRKLFSWQIVELLPINSFVIWFSQASQQTSPWRIYSH